MRERLGMRLGRGCYLIIFCAVLLAAALANIKSAWSVTTIMAISPAIVYESPGESFFVNLTVLSVELLYYWQANVTFNSNVLRMVNVTEGEFLLRQPEGTFGSKQIESSSALFGWTTLGQSVGESGSGTLATMEFEVLAEGESVLELSNIGKETYLVAQTSPNPPPNFEDLEFTAQNGLFLNTVTPAVAAFTYSPLVPGLDELVSFNASDSSATEAGAQIIEYYWDFGDETNASVATALVEHAYTEGGEFVVSLTVIDNATASALVQSVFGTTGMPRLWYELFSTTTQSISVAVPHNIAVTSVSLSANEVTAGDTVSITVKVLNKGTETESFSVKAYYGVNEISTKQVSDLESAQAETLVFDWNTANVPEGTYRITVQVPAVEGETALTDNNFIDGTVKVNPSGGTFPIELMIGGAIVAAIAVVGLGVVLRRRGRSA